MQIILAFVVLSLQYVSAFPSVEAEIAGGCQMKILDECFTEWKDIVRGSVEEMGPNVQITCPACQRALDCLKNEKPLNKEKPCQVQERDVLDAARYFWVAVATIEHKMGICKDNHYEDLKKKLTGTESNGKKFLGFLDDVGPEEWKKCNTNNYFQCAKQDILNFEEDPNSDYCDTVKKYEICLTQLLKTCQSDKIVNIWKKAEKKEDLVLNLGIGCS